jgi:hypothetical protein
MQVETSTGKRRNRKDIERRVATMANSLNDAIGDLTFGGPGFSTKKLTDKAKKFRYRLGRFLDTLERKGVKQYSRRIKVQPCEK